LGGEAYEKRFLRTMQCGALLFAPPDANEPRRAKGCQVEGIERTPSKRQKGSVPVSGGNSPATQSVLQSARETGVEVYVSGPGEVLLPENLR